MYSIIFHHLKTCGILHLRTLAMSLLSCHYGCLYDARSPIDWGAYGLRNESIKRAANRRFLGSEDRGFQLINSIKNKPKKDIYFIYIYIIFSF